MQPLSPDNRQPPDPMDSPPDPSMHEEGLRTPLEDDRIADELEAKSIAWNVARIVRLSSGRYALLTHYRAGALDIIKVGTLEEIAPFIPTPEQCYTEYSARPERKSEKKSDLNTLLADIGL